MLKRKMRFLGLLLWLAAVPIALAGEGDDAYRQAADHYYSFIKSPDKKALHSNWDRLIEEFQSVAESYPESRKADDAWYMVGKLSMDCHKLSGVSSDLESALSAFGVLVEKYSDSTLADDAQYFRGEIYLKLGDVGSARKEFELCLEKFRGGDMVRGARHRITEIDAGKYGSIKKAQSPEQETLQEPAAPEAVAEAEKAGGTTQQDSKADESDIMAEPGESSSIPPGSSSVRHLRYFSGPDYTRIVVDLDKDIRFLPPHMLRPDPNLGTPPRLYVDFTEAILAEELKAETTRKGTFYEVPISDGLLRRARAGQYQTDVVRVVLDIQSIDRYHYFILPPGEEGTKRFVMDVFGSPDKKVAKKDTGAKGHPPPQQPKGPVSVSPGRPLKHGPYKKTAPVIAVDAGHGGKDPGAVGPHGTREKDIALRIAIRLKRELEKEMPEARVILTRTRDEYLTLVERTAKANAADADIFLSIHCNASPNTRAYGMETYYLDNTTDRATLKLAARENFVSEKVMVDSGDLTNQILADLTNTSKVEESIPLAFHIQKSMVKELGARYSYIRDLGVKKGPFWVLTGARMACVLIETSFISCSREEKRLRSDDYQQALATAIARGTRNYLEEFPPLSMPSD
jgi:N-acetylmuramoyl-L-alanine amidase